MASLEVGAENRDTIGCRPGCEVQLAVHDSHVAGRLVSPQAARSISLWSLVHARTLNGRRLRAPCALGLIRVIETGPPETKEPLNCCPFTHLKRALNQALVHVYVLFSLLLITAVPLRLPLVIFLFP